MTYKRKAKDEASRFQSTLPQGKWRKSFWTKLCNLSYFNPHFRKGSDFSAFSIVFCSSISIHTSAREVTDILIRPPPCLKFQSTLPQGKWRRFLTASSTSFWISIHTSAREVTHQHQASHLLGRFQSTLPQGKWLPDYAEEQGNSSFQSTLPQGKWRDINNILCIL